MSTEIVKAESQNPITRIVEPRTSELVAVFNGNAEKAERFKAQAATLAVIGKGEIAHCKPASIWLALKGVAELDLDLTPALGQAYILPYGNTAQLILGYKGMKEIAYRSGVVRRLEAVLVYEKDVFAYQRGTSPRIDHIPAAFDKRGAMIGAYAVATLTNGEIVFEVMSKAEIDAIKARSKSKQTWDNNYGEMARKTPVRRLFKYLPTTPLLSKALAIVDGEPDDIEAADGTTVIAARPRLADHLAAAPAGRDAGAEPETPADQTDRDHGDEPQPVTPTVAGKATPDSPIDEDSIPF